jgi:hypothetical protein
MKTRIEQHAGDRAFSSVIGAFFLLPFLVGVAEAASPTNTLTGSNAGAGLAEGTGLSNTANGNSALKSNKNGSFNTAIGASALTKTTGSGNTGVGFQALLNNKAGGLNVAIGEKALHKNVSGSGNVCLGKDAGLNVTGSNNICIANQGKAAESGVVSIGTEGVHAKTLLAGDIGIGTTNPGRAKVEIIGSSGGYETLATSGIFTSLGTGDTFVAGTYGSASLLCSNDVVAAQYIAFSDERVKHISGRSDSAHDLATLLGIEITDYSFIDTIANGTGTQKKVIAQQVEQVFPQAVSRHTDAVPDIFASAEIKGGWVMLATNLKQGERVRLIDGRKEAVHEVIEVAEDRFRTDLAKFDGSIFVYGREVKDFRSVDYDAIAMLNVSATQELTLKLRTKDVEIAALNEKIAALGERLVRIEGALNGGQSVPVKTSVGRSGPESAVPQRR